MSEFVDRPDLDALEAASTFRDLASRLQVDACRRRRRAAGRAIDTIDRGGRNRPPHSSYSGSCERSRPVARRLRIDEIGVVRIEDLIDERAAVGRFQGMAAKDQINARVRKAAVEDRPSLQSRSALPRPRPHAPPFHRDQRPRPSRDSGWSEILWDHRQFS